MPTLLDYNYVDKEEYEESTLADKFLIKDTDLNQIKNKHNALCAIIEASCRQIIRVYFGAGQFTGAFYQNSDLVGLTTNDFLLFSNDGSGVLQNPTSVTVDGDTIEAAFTFESATGRITIAQGNYFLIIFKPIVLTL